VRFLEPMEGYCIRKGDHVVREPWCYDAGDRGSAGKDGDGRDGEAQRRDAVWAMRRASNFRACPLAASPLTF
jgi:hypothetical protein